MTHLDDLVFCSFVQEFLWLSVDLVEFSKTLWRNFNLFANVHT